MSLLDVPQQSHIIQVFDTPPDFVQPNPSTLDAENIHIAARIPRSSKQDYETMAKMKMALLWTPKSTFTVQNGTVFDIPGCTIRLGELKTSSNSVRAIVVTMEVPSFTESDGYQSYEESDRVRWDMSKIQEDLQLETLKVEYNRRESDAIVKAWIRTLKALK